MGICIVVLTHEHLVYVTWVLLDGFEEVSQSCVIPTLIIPNLVIHMDCFFLFHSTCDSIY